MNCQSLPAWWSPKKHNTLETQKKHNYLPLQYPQLDHRRLSSPGDQERDSAQRHEKASRMWNQPGILCTCARELSKSTKALFSWLPWVPLTSNTVHLPASQTAATLAWGTLTHQTLSPPFFPLQTPHNTAEDPASLWPYFTSTSEPLHNWQWKHLFLFQSLRFSSL